MGDEDDGLLAYARELEEADRALARTAAEIEELRGAVRVLLVRGRELEALLARAPEARAAADEAVLEAERELERRLAERREAEEALVAAEGSGDEERVAAARRAVVRTGDAVTSSEGRVGRARAAREELERQVERAREELPELERRAQELARRLGEVSRLSRHVAQAPAPGLAGTIAWAEKAEAALFVARSGVESARERVAREANELAASALGDPLAATSVSLVRERIERR